MNREQTKNIIKAQLPEYLTTRGFPIRKRFRCLNPEHDDKNPSMGYDRRHHNVHCFSCGTTYDIYDLIGMEYQLTDYKSIFDKAEELYKDKLMNQTEPVIKVIEQKPLDDLTDYFIAKHKEVNKTTYFSDRGLSKEIIDRFNLGYDEAFVTYDNDCQVKWNAIIIPTGKGSFLARNTDKNASKENRIRKHGSSNLFNTDAIHSDKPFYVVEGEIDALSIVELGGQALALGSTSNALKLIELLKKEKPEHPVILSLDNDIEGQDKTRLLEDELKNLKIPFQIMNIAGDFKDPNDALIHEKEALRARVILGMMIEDDEELLKRERYRNTSTDRYLKEFTKGIRDSVNTPYIPTGFNNLDSLMDGGLYEGLYIIGAISSLGKTTLLLQIADQIAKGGQDILIFSLEMSRFELMAKSISRLTMTKCIGNSTPFKANTSNAKTVRGITTGKNYEHYSQAEKDLILESITEYETIAKNIYIKEGMGEIGTKEIREAVEDHVQYTGKHPVVIIDYLQIVSPFNDRMSDKQNMDKAVLELKRISRDFKIPVIAISSFNRSSYNLQVTMEAFKESGAIEYSSDVLIGLQLEGADDKNFDAQNAKSQNPRRIELKILKNRNGKLGSIVFDYYTYFNYFNELRSN